MVYSSDKKVEICGLRIVNCKTSKDNFIKARFLLVSEISLKPSAIVSRKEVVGGKRPFCVCVSIK